MHLPLVFVHVLLLYRQETQMQRSDGLGEGTCYVLGDHRADDTVRLCVYECVCGARGSRLSQVQSSQL